jgi:hypothetical protein
MKLPHPLVDSKFFLFDSAAELISAVGPDISADDVAEIQRLAELGLPPIISRDVLAVMIGVNPGLLWSMERKPFKYYRHFTIKKGMGERHIYAPKVALKIIQKWLSHHLGKFYSPPQHVFGFVPGRSHLQAASIHCGAHWVFSVDIRNFFPSVTAAQVQNTLVTMGYGAHASAFMTKFCCLSGVLAQGAPTSPILSNLVFREADEQIADIALHYGARLSRYADDIVFSGTADFPDDLPAKVGKLFDELPWDLAPEKTETAVLPQRLKVHGLLVHGDHIRLTKGYRNRIRAYQHLLAAGKILEEDQKRVKGHLKYASQVSSS